MAAHEGVQTRSSQKRRESVIVANKNYRGPLVINSSRRIILRNELLNQQVPVHTENEYLTKKRKIIIQKDVRIEYKPCIINRKQRLLRYLREEGNNDDSIRFVDNQVIDLSIGKNASENCIDSSVPDKRYEYVKAGNFEDEYIKRYEMETYGMSAKRYFQFTYNSASLANHSDIFQTPTVPKPLNLSRKEINVGCDRRMVRASRRNTPVPVVEPQIFCDKCEFKCFDDSDLKIHSKVHLNVKIFSCDRCQYKCRLLGKMRIHKMMIHRNQGKKLLVKNKTLKRTRILNKTRIFEKPKILKKTLILKKTKSQGKKLLFKKNRISKKTGAKPVTRSISNIHRNLRFHKKVHVNVKRYFCDLCKFKCILVSSFQKHKINHHLNISKESVKKRTRSEIKSYFCREYIFNSRTPAVELEEIVTPLKRFPCELCPKRFKHHCSLKAHRLVHSGERPYACDECSFTSKTLVLLKNHKNIHFNRNPYSCKTCKFECRNTKILKRHEKEHANDAIGVVCDICSLEFINKVTLRRHLTVHTDSRPFSCDVCQYKCRNITNLNKHKLIHVDDKPFSCKLCKKKFREASVLKKHKQIHNAEKVFKCPECNYTGTNARNLKKHQAVHRESKEYVCGVCDTKFRHSSTLKRHQSTHSNSKLFGCKFCKYKGSNRNNLNRHVLIHTKGTFECDVCQFKTKKKRTLRSHIKSAHSK